MKREDKESRMLRAAMIVTGFLILACAGILAGLLLGRRSRPGTVSDSMVPAAEGVESEAAVTPLPQISDAAPAENEPSPSPSPTPEPDAGEELKGVIGAAIPNVAAYADAKRHSGAPGSAGKLICIDPGHQDHGMSETEPNGPGSSVMKAKLTTGTDGAVSGKSEYEVNLEVSLLLRDELIRRGYNVLMTRETNAVNISNVERAVMANEAHADAFIRIHCNSSDDSSVKGVLCYEPSPSNPYLSPAVIEGSHRLAAVLLEKQVAATGQESRGLLEGDDMTGINWAQMPVTIVEMGFMSNPEEDMFMADPAGQVKIVQGLADGVDAFFAGSAEASPADSSPADEGGN